MEAYKISAVVPVYNVEKYLERCVKSLADQTWQNLEIILVDDGSTDNSGALCDRLAEGSEKIKVIHKENGGLISAWKRGVEEAEGDYLTFVDSDDWVDTRMLSEMGEKLTGSQKEVISSDYVIEEEGGKSRFVFQKLAPGEYTGKRLKEEVVPNLLGHEERYVCISRCMKLISKELVRTNCHYCNPIIRMGEDCTIMLPVLLDCERLVIMDHKAYYHYAYIASSMIHKYDKGLYENIRMLQGIILQIIEDKCSDEKKDLMVKAAWREYIFFLFLALKNEARGNKKGYYKNIAAICRDEEVKKTVKENPVTVSQTSNKLLYAVLKNPSGLMIRLLRLAMIVFYAGK